MVRKCIRTVNKIPQTNIVINYWKPEAHNHYFRFMTFINPDGNQNIDHIKKCDYKIYTSKFNKWYLVEYYRIQEDRIVTVEPGEPLSLDDPNKKQTFRVIALDANFCAGSVMFLFQGSFGNILYTGYFRISSSTSLWKEPVMKEIIDKKVMDCVYFDNSYAAEHCEFPSRAETVGQVVDLLRKRPNDKVYIFGKKLGREEVLLDIARALNVKIHVSEEKFVLLSRLGIPHHFSVEEQNCRISAFDRILRLTECRKIRKDQPTCIFILLTAYHNVENSGTFLRKDVPNLHIFPYSGHCSHKELMNFFTVIQPCEIKPILLDSLKDDISMVPQCMLDLRRRRDKIRDLSTGSCAQSASTNVSGKENSEKNFNDKLRSAAEADLRFIPEQDDFANLLKIIDVRSLKRNSSLLKSCQDETKQIRGRMENIDNNDLSEGALRSKEKKSMKTLITNLSIRTNVTCDHDYAGISGLSTERRQNSEFEVDVEFARNRIGSEIRAQNSAQFEITSGSRVSELPEHETDVRLNSFSKEGVTDKLSKLATVQMEIQTGSVNNDLHRRSSSIPIQSSKNSINSFASSNSDSIVVQRVGKRKYVSSLDKDDSDSDIECIAIVKKSDKNIKSSPQKNYGNSHNELDLEGKSNLNELSFVHLIKEEDMSTLEMDGKKNTEMHVSLATSNEGFISSLRKSAALVPEMRSPRKVSYSIAQTSQTNPLKSNYNKSGRNCKINGGDLLGENEFHVDGVKVAPNQSTHGKQRDHLVKVDIHSTGQENCLRMHPEGTNTSSELCLNTSDDQLQHFTNIVRNYSTSEEHSLRTHPVDANMSGELSLSENDISATAALPNNSQIIEESRNEPEVTNETLDSPRKFTIRKMKQLSQEDTYTSCQLFLKTYLAYNFEDLDGCNIFSYPHYK